MRNSLSCYFFSLVVATLGRTLLHIRVCIRFFSLRTTQTYTSHMRTHRTNGTQDEERIYIFYMLYTIAYCIHNNAALFSDTPKRRSSDWSCEPYTILHFLLSFPLSFSRACACSLSLFLSSYGRCFLSVCSAAAVCCSADFPFFTVYRVAVLCCAVQFIFFLHRRSIDSDGYMYLYYACHGIVDGIDCIREMYNSFDDKQLFRLANRHRALFCLDICELWMRQMRMLRWFLIILKSHICIIHRNICYLYLYINMCVSWPPRN